MNPVQVFDDFWETPWAIESVFNKDALMLLYITGHAISKMYRWAVKASTSIG